MVSVRREHRARPASRWSILPRLVADAPPAITLVVGAIVLILALLIITRPLTSLVLLTVYVGVSVVLSGVSEVVRTTDAGSLPRRLFGGAWIVVGLALLTGLGRTLEELPGILAMLLVLAGLASLFDAITQGSVSERVLATAWGGAQIVFGILALTWPDVTLLVVAVVFGVRSAVFGLTLIIRGLRGFGPGSGGRRAMSDAFTAPPEYHDAPSRVAHRWRATGRFALSLVLVLLASGSWYLGSWIQSGAPVVDAFYDPPAVVPYDNGRLIRADAFSGQSPPGGDVQRILYTTRDALGRPAVASALVITPTESRPGARPVVVWNHGTTGVARGCAPSLRDASATHWAIPGLNDALERGWVVVASDYSGQGAPGVFPYLIGRGEARSSLDAVLAARELDGVALSRSTVAWGHSQGGHAALWMAEIAADYAPDIDLLGAAVLAPVTDPLELADEVTRNVATAELSIISSWVLVPYADTYDDVDLSRYVAPGAQTLVREMTQRCPTEPGVIVSVATALGVSEDSPLFPADLTTGPLGARLAENAATGPWDVPILVAWGDADEVIPARLQEGFVERACAQGDEVRWAVYAGYDHLATVLPRSRFLPVLISWTEALFTGRDAPTDDCARYADAAP